MIFFFCLLIIENFRFVSQCTATRQNIRGITKLEKKSDEHLISVFEEPSLLRAERVKSPLMIRRPVTIRPALSEKIYRSSFSGYEFLSIPISPHRSMYAPGHACSRSRLAVRAVRSENNGSLGSILPVM